MIMQGAKAPLSHAAKAAHSRPANNSDELLTIHQDLQRQLTLLGSVEGLIKRQVALLTQLVSNSQMVDPNYRRPLAQYRMFDWSAIGATILEHDNFGPTVVEWGGHHWLRRNKSDKKFGTAVWFSRHASGSGDHAAYYTLIKFVQRYDIEPMETDIVDSIGEEPSQPTPITQPASGTIVKDWYQDAITCMAELPFDTAIQRHRPNYYTDANQVTRARQHICGQWVDDPVHVKATADALVLYADRMLSARRNGGPLNQEHSKTAVAKAKRLYKDAIGK